jgi:hypothetical protein
MSQESRLAALEELLMEDDSRARILPNGKVVRVATAMLNQGTGAAVMAINEEDLLTAYALWAGPADWGVIAHERMGNSPVVSVQFLPSSRGRRSVPPEPSKMKHRELEFA